MAGKRSRTWCITDHDTSEERKRWLNENVEEIQSLEYFVWGLETCPKTKKEHGQGYVRFAHAVTLSACKKRLGSNTVHLEVKRGTEYEAASYCWKECDDPIEFGTRPEEDGSHRDASVWDVILRMLGDGASNAEIMRAYPAAYARYSTGIEKMRMDILSERLNHWRDVRVTYVWGKTGVGKTRTILEGVEDPSDVFRVTDYRHPFDSYRGQKILMFEEFRSSLPIEQMLILLDGYTCELPCRYANKVSGWDEVFIVTNVEPHEQYSNVQHNHPETYAAWERRIGQFVNLENTHYTGVTKGNTETLVSSADDSDSKEDRL